MKIFDHTRKMELAAAPGPPSPLEEIIIIRGVARRMASRSIDAVRPRTRVTTYIFRGTSGISRSSLQTGLKSSRREYRGALAARRFLFSKSGRAIVTREALWRSFNCNLRFARGSELLSPVVCRFNELHANLISCAADLHCA